jgi:hypothetical protein
MDQRSADKARRRLIILEKTEQAAVPGQMPLGGDEGGPA